MSLLQEPSCYILPLDMEAAYPVEPATSTRWENGFVARTGVPEKDSSQFWYRSNSSYSLKYFATSSTSNNTRHILVDSCFVWGV